MDKQQHLYDLLGYLTRDCRDMAELSDRIEHVYSIAEMCQRSLVNLMLQYESMATDEDFLPVSSPFLPHSGDSREQYLETASYIHLFRGAGTA